MNPLKKKQIAWFKFRLFLSKVNIEETYHFLLININNVCFSITGFFMFCFLLDFQL